MNHSRRMKLKALACAAGIVLLFILAIAGLIGGIRLIVNRHEPVIEQFTNVWITEVTEDTLRFFDGTQREHGWTEEMAALADRSFREQVADVTLTDGLVSAVTVKNSEKISGKVLRIFPGQGVELQEHGALEFAPDVKMYRLYDTLQLAGTGDIRIGYAFCDFVMEEGKICGVLVTRNEAMEYIRVQIKSSGYASPVHETVSLTADTDFVVRFGSGDSVTEEVHQAGDVIEILPDSSYFVADRIYVEPQALTGKISLLSVERSQGTPAYRGTMEIIKEEAGLYVVNEVLLEEYLYSVVPSEMPSGYPLEALKAQVICARTYAYSRMLGYAGALTGAHVDDSAGYQVYNNIPEQESTTAAVKETQGQLLYVGKQLADTYYYSTSCGYGTESDIWKGGTGQALSYLPARRIGTELDPAYTAESMREEEVFEDFIRQAFETDYESREPWYRWIYQVEEIDEERMLESLQARYAANSSLVLTRNSKWEFESREIKKLGAIKSIRICARNEGGVADELLIEAKHGVYKVISEHNIRCVLCDGVTQVRRQDGSLIDMPNLLPSAFFTIITGQEKGNVVRYTLIGGGFGHGVGMSQNGARSMAEKGLSAQEVLEFFYQSGTVKQIY